MSEMNEYLKELQDSARQVMDGEGPAAPETKLWPLLVELGWLLTSVPEELDGLGLGARGACMLQTELGRGLAQVPFLSAGLALEAIAQSELADKAALLERLTTGELATAALADAAELSLDEGVLNGQVAVVPSADTASDLLVWSRGCVALVKLDQAGVERRERPTWDTTRRLFDVSLQNVALADQVVLAEGEAADRLVQRLQTLRDFGLAADAIGASAGLLAMTVEHLQTRVQFGRPLAMFQALKHRCADMKTLLDTAESLLADSLARTGEAPDSEEAQLLGKKTKLVACSSFSAIAEDALQLFGGIGMASEHPCHLYLKRAMLNEHLGTGEDSYELAIADRFLAQLA